MSSDDERSAAVHRDLVDHLKHDLRPVRRLWSPWVRLAGWLAVAFATVGGAAIFGLRDDLVSQLAQPRFVITLAALLAGAGLAAYVALLASVPGRISRVEARLVGGGVLVLAVITALLGERIPAPSMLTFVLYGLRCTVCVAAFALVPWWVLFRAARRAAPLDGRTAGLCMGAAAVLVGAACVRVACPIDDTIHLAVWHGLPPVLWTSLSVAAGGVWLVRWLAADGRSLAD